MGKVLCRRLVALLALVMLAGCLPIPMVKLELNLPYPEYQLDPEQVHTDYVRLEGFPAPHTPERYNQTFYLRYYLENEPTDTILILMPGIFGGATTFNILASQLVATTPGLEVWAIDRRANALEDRSASLVSLRHDHPLAAYAYYVRDAGTAEGFTPIPPEDVRFLGFWGLEVHLWDLHQVVLRANARARQVILGGHSLGAALVSLYAAYDFGEDDPEPGYRYIDGLLLLDGALGRTGAFAREDVRLGFGPIRITPSIAELEAGKGSPYLTVGLTPSKFAKSEAAALLAHFAPEALSPGGFYDFPITNRAVVGVRSDDQYGPTPVFSVSLGQAVGAELDGNLAAVILSGHLGFGSQSVAGVAEGYDYVSWQPGEYTDINAFVRSWASPHSNYNEWYFPVRLLLDVIQLEPRLEHSPHFVSQAEVPTPTLAIGAERGLISSLDGFSTYFNIRPGAPFSSYILPGFTHTDLVTAEKNPVVPLFRRWLKMSVPGS